MSFLSVEPYPLGLIVVPDAGTPVQVTSTITRAHTVLIQAWHTNSANVYLGTSAMNKSTGAGVMLYLTGAADSRSFSIEKLGVIDPRQLYLDVDTGGEGALVTLLWR